MNRFKYIKLYLAFFPLLALSIDCSGQTYRTALDDSYDLDGASSTPANTQGIPDITGVPAYTPVTATTGYISLDWDEAPYGGSGALGVITAADFLRTFLKNGGTANSFTITGLQDSSGGSLEVGETSMRILISFDTATSGSESFQINALAGEIFSGVGPYNTSPVTTQAGPFTAPDYTAPAQPLALDLDSLDDSGLSNLDNITSQSVNLTVSGTSEANATIRLYQPNSAGTLLNTVSANSLGIWSADISLLAGSTYTVVATATDAFSNTGMDSSALSITVDTTADSSPGTPDLQLVSDTGSSSTDDLTNDTTPSFSVSCADGSSVQLYANAVLTGTPGICAGGTASVTASALVEGTITITAAQTDPAGNTSVASAGLIITLDTTADSATGAPDLQASSDTGVSDTDNITNDTTPSYAVSCTNLSSVQLYEGVSPTGANATCASGTVTLTASALSDGLHNIHAIQTDPAGNSSVASASLSVTIDTSPDSAPGTPDMQSASDTGTLDTDNITSQTGPIFDMTCVTGSTLQLYDGVSATGSPALCSGGNVSLTAVALGNGLHNVNALQTDTAGNVSLASANLSVTIDTGIPSVPSGFDLNSVDDTGTVNTDDVTKLTSGLTISGTSEANAIIRVYLTSSAGTLLLTSNADGAGNWSGDIALSEGTNAIVATATDIAGNMSVDSASFNIVIDTTAPLNQDSVYSASSNRYGGGAVVISSSGTASNEVWFAPAGTSAFSEGVTMTKAVSGTAVSILAPANAGTYKLYVLDLAGNISAESGAVLTVDNTLPVISGTTPLANAYINTTAVSYTLSENCVSGSVTWSRTGGSADVSSPHTANFTGAELTAGTKSNIVLSNAPTLVSNAIYTVSFDCTDSAGNSATTVNNLNVTFDTTLPVISGLTPATNANVNNTSVSYTLSEICQTATLTWTQTGGTVDGSSPHLKSLSGAELNAGTFTGTITNNPTLADGSIYSLAAECTDRAGNIALMVTNTNITYSPGVLAITTADTLDTDNDGKIDTYRIGFNKSIDDSTFPGFIADSLGSVTTDWLVAGFTNVRLIHGTAVAFATDTADDAVIYLKFDETVLECSVNTQVGCDTNVKPDLTTTALPGLRDLTLALLAPVNTGTITEADGAKPVLVAARSLGTNSADAIFSEPVDTVEGQTASNYGITGGANPSVSAANRDGTSTNIVHLTTGAQTGGQAYVLTVNTNVKDLANFNLNALANSVNFNGVVDPVVSGIVSGSATTLTITFNESVKASTAECANQTACAFIYQNLSLPVLSAVSTGGAGVDSATFILTVNPMVEGQAYTTSILASKIEASGAPAGRYVSAPDNSATFNGDGLPAATISTDTTTACPANGAARVVIQFDQGVSATALTATNYKITGCISGASCSTGTGVPNLNGASTVTDQGANKFAVDFSANFATDDTLYQITLSSIQDTNGNTIAAPGNLSFQCGTDTTAPVLVGASVLSATAGSTVVQVTFSEGVDNVTANVAGNYKSDSSAYGAGVLSAARQTNTAQVVLTFQPALTNGGHQIRAQNVADLKLPTGNIIVDNGVTNVQPIIVNAPAGFTGGAVFNDPFGDGTTAGSVVVYDAKLYVGTDTASSKLFEMNYGMTTAQTITLDADGTFGAPYSTFDGYLTKYSGCTTAFSNPPLPAEACSPQNAIQGIDSMFAGCVGGTSTPGLTGSACTSVGGTEYFFIGAKRTASATSAYYRSFWYTSTKSSVSTVFPFSEGYSGDTGGGYAYRSMNFILFKDQLFVNFGAEAGGGNRGGRVCMKAGGCDNGNVFQGYTSLSQWSRMRRVGVSSANSLRNGSYNGGGAPYADTSSGLVFNAINTMYEYDVDGMGGNESQLYVANGGFTNSTLGLPRTGNTDGGIMRSVLAYSSRSQLMANCPSDSSGCSAYFEDITPDSLTKWNSYISIPWPQNTAVTGSGNCATSVIEMDCSVPYNLFIPSMKAIPYMRTAPNGDLYMLRNACSTNAFAVNGGANDFRTMKQVCPPGSEIPQLWMMPKNCTDAATCSGAWQLVAEYGTTGKTNMASNTGDCGNAPNICLNNSHITLLEFVGNTMYIGYDNATNGSNIWRVDMSGVPQGSVPLESSFSIVSVPGIESGGGGTNQKIFSHVTMNDGSKDWLMIITRDGSSAMKIYRTANDQD